MRATWFVRSRQMRTRFAFWLSLIGYNLRDRSLSQKIYLGYAIVFFSIWGFAVLSLLAGVTSSFLAALGVGSVDLAASTLGVLIFSVWFLLSLRAVSRRSPFVFSEEDAYLICQTPVDRRGVALSWFISDWIGAGIPFWAGAVTLGFARAEAVLAGNATLLDIPFYVGLGLRALSVALLLQLALLALAWAVGALRLRGDREIAWLDKAALALIAVFVVAALWTLLTSGMAGFSATGWQVSLWVLSFPLKAAFGTAPWAWGAGFALLLVLLALAALWAASPELNLSRAAQETSGQEAQRSASLYGNTDLAQELAQRERLGMGRAPTRLRGRAGAWSLIWKDAVQALRPFRVTGILPWLGVFSMGLAGGFAAGLGTRIWVLAAWAILISQQAGSRLRGDLRLWPVLRQLPFTSKTLLLAEVANPWLLTVLATWIGLAAGSGLGGSLNLILAVLAPGAAAGVAASAAYDILRQSRVSALLAGSAADVGAWGAALSLICAGVPAGILWWVSNAGLPLALGTPLAWLAGLGLAALLWNLAAKSLREME